jgi:long-chain acyl-CoA synthetase
MAPNVYALLAPHLRAGNTAPAQRFLTDSGWRRRSYGELDARARGVAARLQQAGIGRGDRIAILLDTRADWTVIDLAAALIGAPLVPVYPTSAPAQIADIVERARPALLIAEVGRELPELGGQAVLRVGTTDGDLGELDPADGTPLAIDVEGDDLFTISFSSGATGTPKGCLLSHANYVAVLQAAIIAETHPTRALAHREAAFVFLPLAHASARLQQLTTLAAGGELVYGTGDTAQLLAQISETRPTYVPGVPRFFESAYLRAGRDSTVLREMFGDRLVYALTGGAPIAPEMLATYEAAGIPLVEGYGLTETSTALAIATPHLNRPGTVGRPLPGVEISIADDGEILARGANVFSGYLDDEAATAAAFRDGWFLTGDLGRIDDEGFLAVTGRKKNLIVTSTGKNVAPESAENQFRQSCRIDGVVVVGDARPFLIAVVTTGEHPADDAELLAAARSINAAVSPPERIRKIVVVGASLSPAGGEITASGKVVRQAVIDRFSAVIDDAYSGRTSVGVRVLDIEPRPLRAVG